MFVEDVFLGGWKSIFFSFPFLLFLFLEKKRKRKAEKKEPKKRIKEKDKKEIYHLYLIISHPSIRLP